MDFETILDVLALVLILVMTPVVLVSKTMVWHPPFRSKPQKTTWFGRVFILLAGSAGTLQFGLAILERKHITINPAWSNIGLPISRFILTILLLAVALPVLILSLGALIRREEVSRSDRLITLFLTIISAYLLWNLIPGITKEVSAFFRR